VLPVLTGKWRSFRPDASSVASSVRDSLVCPAACRLAGENLALHRPIRNRHWQSPGRYHNKLPNSPGTELHSFMLKAGRSWKKRSGIL
jgi:hypothetical protein